MKDFVSSSCVVHKSLRILCIIVVHKPILQINSRLVLPPPLISLIPHTLLVETAVTSWEYLLTKEGLVPIPVKNVFHEQRVISFNHLLTLPPIHLPQTTKLDHPFHNLSKPLAEHTGIPGIVPSLARVAR